MTNQSLKAAFQRFWEHVVDKISDKADINHTHNWNDLKDKPFGETTVTGDTLTWDGDMTGREVTSVAREESLTMNFVYVSDSVPTAEEFASGGVISIIEGETVASEAFTAEVVGNGGSYLALADMFVIALVDNVAIDNYGVTLPKAGVYFVSIAVNGVEAARASSLKINNYKGFESTEITPIPEKYLPASVGGGGVMRVNSTINSMTEDMNFDVTLDKSYIEILNHYENGGFVFVSFDMASVGENCEIILPMYNLDKEQNTLSFTVIYNGITVEASIESDNTASVTMIYPE